MSLIKTTSNKVATYCEHLRRLALVLLLTGAVMAGTGCTNIRTIAMKDAFPVNDAIHQSGPPVTLFPVQEALEVNSEIAPYLADQTYLGKGVSEFAGYGPLPILPFMVEYDEFHADSSRTDIVRSAVLSRLNSLGIPAIYQAKDNKNQPPMPEDSLGITVRIRKLNVDTQYSDFLTMLIVSGFHYSDNVAHAVLDCKLLKSGQTTPLWEGTVDGLYDTKDHKEHAYYQQGNVVGGAVYAAVDQCVTKSGLMEVRTRISSERYARLMANGSKLAEDGKIVKAMDMYGQASKSALTPEQNLDAVNAMVQLYQSLQQKPAISEEAWKFKVQAEVAVRDNSFAEAASLYEKAINVAPWWPEAHFNRAMVLGETGEYTIAKQEMTFFLQLMPEAPNARAAQDKVYEWERLESKQGRDAPNTSAVQDNSSKSGRGLGVHSK